MYHAVHLTHPLCICSGQWCTVGVSLCTRLGVYWGLLLLPAAAPNNGILLAATSVFATHTAKCPSVPTRHYSE